MDSDSAVVSVFDKAFPLEAILKKLTRERVVPIILAKSD